MTDYLAEYREIAKLGGNFRGLSLVQHVREIRDVIARHRAKTILDWGSGAGDAYRPPHEVHITWGVNRFKIRLYDPSFPKLCGPPPPNTRFDGVICSDVLEHIPEADVPAVLETLFGHAGTFLWASVCCRKAKKKFADGTNMHLTVRPREWWLEQMAAACPEGVVFYLTETP